MNKIEFYKETEFKETPIGKIPKDWEVQKLGNIITYIKGKKPKEMTEQYQEGYLPYLSAEYLRESKATNFVKPSNDVILVNDGDLILLWDGSNAGEFFYGKRGVLSSTMVKIEQRKRVFDRKFLFYILKMKENFLKGQTKGTGIPHVDEDVLNSIILPSPSPLEQRAIAEVLSVVDLAIQRTDEVIVKTERLKKGLMQTLLTRGIGHKEFKETPIGKIPKTWQIVKIEDVAETTSGGTPDRSKKEYYGGTIPWVKSGELKDNTIYDTEEKITEIGLKNSAAKLLPKGTLLVAMYGATVGKTGILGIEAATNQAICAILPKDTRLNLKFLQYYIIFARNRWILQSSGGAQPNISQEIIRKSKIPLPPPEEQQRIADILSIIDEKIELESKKKSGLEKVKRGLMNLLLTGKIRIMVR